MRRGSRGQWEISFEQVRSTDDPDSGRVREQLVQQYLPQGMEEPNELPPFLDRLSFADIARELEEGTPDGGSRAVHSRPGESSESDRG